MQNQTGPHASKWDRNGIVIEVRQFDQYVVKDDGSGHVTLRNRKSLRRYLPLINKSQKADMSPQKAKMPSFNVEHIFSVRKK